MLRTKLIFQRALGKKNAVAGKKKCMKKFTAVIQRNFQYKLLLVLTHDLRHPWSFQGLTGLWEQNS